MRGLEGGLDLGFTTLMFCFSSGFRHSKGCSIKHVLKRQITQNDLKLPQKAHVCIIPSLTNTDCRRSFKVLSQNYTPKEIPWRHVTSMKQTTKLHSTVHVSPQDVPKRNTCTWPLSHRLPFRREVSEKFPTNFAYQAFLSATSESISWDQLAIFRRAKLFKDYVWFLRS